MKYGKKNIAILLLTLMLTTLCASCSNKGVQMPKHRMRRHCNCPTFSQLQGALETYIWTPIESEGIEELINE